MASTEYEPDPILKLIWKSITGLPPSELTADHVRPTIPDAVTDALFVKV